MSHFCRFSLIIVLLGALFCPGCGKRGDSSAEVSTEPQYLEIHDRPEGGWTIVSVSPSDGSRDSIIIDKPLERLIVMSTSHVGFLDALGRRDLIVGASGTDYIHEYDLVSPSRLAESDQSSILERSDAGSLRGTPLSPPGGRRGVDESSEVRASELAEQAYPADIGYDAAADYEKIVALRPDMVLTYAVSGAKSPFITKLEQLGIQVFTVNEHLECHPLARAAYIRLFGAITGQMAAADSVLSTVSASYTAIADEVKEKGGEPRKVLLNIPYNDQWFVPSTRNYLTSMIRDAGGIVLGCESGSSASSVMSVEKAYSLSKEADCWLNVGWCQTEEQLLGVNPIFTDILGNIRSNATQRGFDASMVVWNDNKRVNAKGGNDIWQSGVVRPDLVLKDIATILHPTESDYNTIYYQTIN